MSIDRNLDHVLSPGGVGRERQDTDRHVDAEPEEHGALEEPPSRRRRGSRRRPSTDTPFQPGLDLDLWTSPA